MKPKLEINLEESVCEGRQRFLDAGYTIEEYHEEMDRSFKKYLADLESKKTEPPQK